MSRTKLLTYGILILSVYLFSCTEEFHPEIDSDISTLVVDGKITNAKGPYQVRLFRTADINNPISINPQEGAVISIYDDKGNSDSFIETSPGIYHNLTTDFRGIVGRSYWIEIQTSDGKKYESTPEMIQPEVLIENIYGEETKVIQDNGEYLKGVEFYMDANSPSNQGNYLRWEYKESWEWHSPYDIPKTDNPSRICYLNNLSNNIAVFDGTKQSKKEFKHLSTRFINDNEVKLNYNYFLDISLYSVTPRNYQFWKILQKSIQNNGGIYDVIPSDAEGNICPCDDKDSVIGYFEASSVSTMKQFFSIADFDMKFAYSPDECDEYPINGDVTEPDTTNVHIVRTEAKGNITWYYVRLNQCYDCNFKYSPKKPSFWP